MGRVFIPHMDAFFEIWVGISCLRIGVCDLHHGGGAVSIRTGEAVAATDDGIAAENMCAAVFPA